MACPASLAPLIEVLGLLEQLGIIYLLGGSFASSIHGVPRGTRDADLLVELSREQARALAEGLGPAYYSDVAMMEDSLARGISFNVIHIATSFKIDFFPAGRGDFERSELARRQREPLGDHYAFVSTAEDTLLAKLRWYREGGECSDTQWRDIMGIVEVRADSLDDAYLEQWARDLGLGGLLERARRGAGPARG